MQHIDRHITRHDRDELASLLEAAERGRPDAQYRLGRLYALGWGVRRDYLLAEYWYRQAAEQRHRQAMFSLAVMYDFGNGVEQNDREAMRWYRLAGWDSLARICWEEMLRRKSGVETRAADANEGQR